MWEIYDPRQFAVTGRTNSEDVFIAERRHRHNKSPHTVQSDLMHRRVSDGVRKSQVAQQAYKIKSNGETMVTTK